MKQKPITTILYSTAGVLALFLVLVAVNYLNTFVKQRIDLTQEKTFTLSEGTKAVLSKLDTPVQIRLYVTQRDTSMPVYLKTYASRVEDLLGEYVQASKGMIELQKLDPEPDSDAEDSARIDGVEGQMLPTGERLYLGLSVSMLDKKDAIPFLSPGRERQLEYDVTRIISGVTNPQKTVVGIMSSLPVQGLPPQMMMQMGRQGGQQPWAFYNELKGNFTVETVDMAAEAIPDSIKVLVVIHPKEITEKTEYAIDQFLMRGGKLVAFLDPVSVIDSQRSPFGGAPSSSTFRKLLPAWGISMTEGQVVADMKYCARSGNGQRAPTVLALDENAFSRDDVITADASNALYVFGGAFSGTPAQGLTETVLMHSSKKSQLVDPMMAQMGGEQIARTFQASETEQALAIRLTGKFKTAFPDGKPKADANDPAKPAADQKQESLKESKEDTSVVLFADCDFIQDPVAIEEIPNPFGGQRMAMPSNGNLSLAQNTVESLTGDNALIKLRSRSVVERPFTVVKEMQERAEASYRSKIQDLEKSLQEAQGRINELQRSKEAGQKYILSPEQQKELEKVRNKEVETKKELKTVRRSLRADIDSLETRLKWLNIAAVPAVVALLGITIGIIKRKRSAAR